MGKMDVAQMLTHVCDPLPAPGTYRVKGNFLLRLNSDRYSNPVLYAKA